ncbi:arginine--tRNA ligase [Patescibacteria group bacterium]|nr:arginine--tRNA ligase [Patescibacteria group bacterium]MBU1015520.1 arginine--tRNA ligase [Patescibacteria group bacterium]MBU1685638.1 arginine--tRNA ligase [Patescibacteria group bacterium]MBU1938131.1 arginine--tRNA ligase [Patescibacteria group bacterium]
MKKRNLSIIKWVFLEAVKKTGYEADPDQIHVEKIKEFRFGDFSTNIAMLLANKEGKRLHEMAAEIVKHTKSDLFEKVEVAGPGFINVRLEQKFYTSEASEWLDDFDGYLKDFFNLTEKKRAVIDYSHPNIAKPMGVHHLLSTVIGDSIKKIYQRFGWEIISDNFIGDMGTQFGKLMHAIKRWGNMQEIEKNPIPALQKLYVQFHMEADKEVELDDEGRAEYRKFEEGDKESRKLWNKIVKWSLLDMQQIYDRLGVRFDHMNGESFYEDKMQVVLDEGRKQGVIVDGEGGSWIIKPDDPEDVPVLVRKSDGATLYVTRDLARIKYWQEEWSPDLMLNVVDVAQSFHFRQLIFAQRKLGLTPARNEHIAFGRMQFADGQMSTRKGNILLLMDLLDESEKRALTLVNEKDVELSDNEKRELARIMGIGSVKYNILQQSRTTNITFDWDRMLSFEGNSAPYLMYTVTRAKSVLRKAGLKPRDCRKHSLDLDLDIERKLMIQLMMYPDTIRRASEEFKPNHIANYLYELAQDFNSFYNGNSILQAESKDLKASRLMLTALTILVMEDGFKLLGLEVPEKM